MKENNLNNKTSADAKSILPAVNPIVDICGDTIDLRKVEMVGSVGGDNSWLRYSVYFISGREIEIYEEKRYVDNRKLRQMKREEFIKLWQSFNRC